jgi:hypothetical protein
VLQISFWAWKLKEIRKEEKRSECKQVRVPIPFGVKLYADQCPKAQEEEKVMSCAPYVSAVGSLMYEMVCTKSDIAHAVRFLSMYMSKLGKEHWETCCIFPHFSCHLDFHVHCWVVFQHMVFTDGFLFPIN